MERCYNCGGNHRTAECWYTRRLNCNQWGRLGYKRSICNYDAGDTSSSDHYWGQGNVEDDYYSSSEDDYWNQEEEEESNKTSSNYWEQEQEEEEYCNSTSSEEINENEDDEEACIIQ